MTVKTIPGVTYVVSAAGECSVTAVTDEGTLLTLAQVRGGGQKAFQAIGAEVEVSDASAVVLPFVDAPVPLGMDGGASGGQVAEMVESALNEFAPVELETAAGTANAMCQYIELDAQHVPQGRLESVSLRCRSQNNPSTFSFMAVWELGEDGATWSYLGSSSNAPGQAANKMMSWVFEEGICLSGRKLRLLAQAQRSGVWALGPQFGVRTMSTPEGDETRCYYGSQGYAFLPELSVAVQQPVPRFAEAGHVADAVAHVSQEEHAWLSGLRGGSQEGAVPVLYMKGAQGNTLLVVRGNETNVSVSGSQLSFNVPRLLAMSDCPVLYRYDAASGVSEVWLAGASDETLLAPLGLTVPGTYVGAPSLPLCLRGSALSFNGTEIDVPGLAELLARKDELLALLAAG